MAIGKRKLPVDEAPTTRRKTNWKQALLTFPKPVDVDVDVGVGQDVPPANGNVNNPPGMPDCITRDLPGSSSSSSSSTGSISLYPRFASLELAAQWMDRLEATLPWRQFPIQIYGKSVMQPRLVCALGEDPSITYRYSNTLVVPVQWDAFPPIREIKHRVESTLKTTFNSVLCNLYRNGQDYMGYHADDEKELIAPGKTLATSSIQIASVSLGAQRRFLVQSKSKSKSKTAGETIEYKLDPGSLLVMDGCMQAHWKHSIPKAAKIATPRINLTFRNMYPIPR